MARTDARFGGVLPARAVFYWAFGLFAFWILLLPLQPAQAGMIGFLAGSMVWLRLTLRDPLRRLSIRRTHRPRVFESDRLQVTLRVGLEEGLPIQLLEVEDLMGVSLAASQRDLIPLLTGGWEVLIHYETVADRHRGLYLMGPVRVLAADGLGVFFHEDELEPVTRLTVYPHADPLPGYAVPGPFPPPGASMDFDARVGLGEEVLGVREYQKGDPPQRIHWRTSARRRRLHVVQLNRPIQVEMAVFVDLTRPSRFGLGAESTTEIGINAAVSILTRAYEARHRFSLTLIQQEPTVYHAATGLDHLHLLLDRLAVAEPAGEGGFWDQCAARAMTLPRGSRAVFIVCAQRTPLELACGLVQRLLERGLGVDVVLIDESGFIRIWRDQEADRRIEPSIGEKILALKRTGARLYALGREHTSLVAARRAWTERVLPKAAK